jgi:hypothetical protein
MRIQAGNRSGKFRRCASGARGTSMRISILRVSVWSIVGATVFAMPAAAQNVSDGLRACAAIGDGDQRLACYDRELARALASTAAPATPAREPQRLTPEERFGMRGELARVEKERSRVGDPDLNQLEAKIMRLEELPTGEQVVTLENGQVWQERTPGVLRAKVGDSVTIRSGSLGSFFMTGRSGRAARVSRLR